MSHRILGICVLCGKNISTLHASRSCVSRNLNIHKTCYTKHFDEPHINDKGTYFEYLEKFEAAVINQFKNVEIARVNNHVVSFLDCFATHGRKDGFFIFKNATYNAEKDVIVGINKGFHLSLEKFIEKNYIKKLKR